MPALITFDSKTTKAIVRYYTKDEVPLAELAETFDTSITVIRRVLVENGVEIRPRGRRPNA